jgi:hypothetical protein
MATRSDSIKGCPPWCLESHDDGEARHLADLQSVAVTLDGGPGHVPNLSFDLRQGDDGRPVSHLELDEESVARFEPAQAAGVGALLIKLARLAGPR